MKYQVKFWCGSGYYLNNAVEVEADDDDLETVLILASIKDKNCLFIDATKADPDDKLDEDDLFTYLDRTEHGASCGYLCVENIKIADETGKVVFSD